jgi:hypothetical protein
LVVRGCRRFPGTVGRSAPLFIVVRHVDGPVLLVVDKEVKVLLTVDEVGYVLLVVDGVKYVKVVSVLPSVLVASSSMMVDAS